MLFEPVQTPGASSFEPGDRVGSYELLAPIGAGGMGRVWVARELGTLRLVAIKTALTEQAAGEQFWRVLLDEARIASRVQHPNVCAIHGADQQQGVVYLVMDYSDGGSLRELLDAASGSRLDFDVAARIAARVCAGLHAVHELTDDDGSSLHVVHRDVSPQNILLSSNGQVRLTDFGIAKARGQLHAPTQTGEVKGKLSYMAPEQVTTKDVDRRADIFALGCVLYEATTGVRPFRGDDALATMYQLLERPLVLPSELCPEYPEALQAIVVKALERDPARRYQTAEQLGRALEGFLVERRVVLSEMEIGALTRRVLAARISARTRELEAAAARLDRTLAQVSTAEVERASRKLVQGASSATSSSPPVAKSTEARRGAFFGTVALGLLGLGAASFWFAMRGPSDTGAAAEPARSAPSSALDTATVVTVATVATVAPVAPSASSTPEAPVTDPVSAPEAALSPPPTSAPALQVNKKPMSSRTPVRPRSDRQSPVATSPGALPTPPPVSTTVPGGVGKRPVRTLDPDNPFAPKP